MGAQVDQSMKKEDWNLFDSILKALTGHFEDFRQIDTSTLSDPRQWLVDFWGGSDTKTGIKVNEMTAMQCTTVLACVRILSETLASLPLIVYRRLTGGGKDRAIDHPLYEILHSQVNKYVTSFEWRETLMGHLALWGNAYSEIERNNGGRIIALWPLRPDKMRLESKGRDIRYFYTPPNDVERELPGINLLHMKGLSATGYMGQSIIGFAREAIGLSLATEDFGARFFSNDATPNAVLEHPGHLTEGAKENLRKSWEKQHQGLEQKHRMAILEEGLKFSTVGMPLEDAQFLQIRKYQAAEIAKIFRIPLHMIDEDSKAATYASVEQFQIMFVTHTMLAWFVRWEQALRRDLFLPSERGEFFSEFLVSGLLRGDMQSRYTAYQIGRQNGWLNADEIREMENLNPLPDGRGQIYYMPLNFAPVGKEVPLRTNGGYVDGKEDREEIRE